MGTSREAFDQVKNILRKLDRSIDAARDQRLAGQDTDEPGAPAPGGVDPARPLRAKPMKPRAAGIDPTDRWADSRGQD